MKDDKEMYELMIHMIGYGNVESNFMDVISQGDRWSEETVLALVKICDDEWASDMLPRIKNEYKRSSCLVEHSEEECFSCGTTKSEYDNDTGRYGWDVGRRCCAQSFRGDWEAEARLNWLREKALEEMEE